MRTSIKFVASGICLVLISILLHRVENIVYQDLIGFCIGLFLSSMHESYVHQYLGHAKANTRDFWKRHPRIFLPLIEGFFLHHIVHHAKTYREGYLEQFGQALDPTKVDTWGPDAFYRLFAAKDQNWIRTKMPPEVIVQHLHEADYGLGAVSGLKFASTTLPVVALLFIVAPFWMAVTASLPILFVYPAMSNTIHRNMMHMPQDGGAPTRHAKGGWLVGTSYMKALERWHWMHHEYIYCNYNLLVLADFFRLKARRKPSAEDKEKMAAEGLVMDEWFVTTFVRRALRNKYQST